KAIFGACGQADPARAIGLVARSCAQFAGVTVANDEEFEAVECVAVAWGSKVHARRQRPPELAGDVEAEIARALQHQRRLELGGDIPADDGESRRSQVQ